MSETHAPEPEDRSPPPALPPPKVSLGSFHPEVVAAHRRGSLLMALPGVVGVIAAPFWVWRFGISALDVALFVVMFG